jgi:hypothetical protein
MQIVARVSSGPQHRSCERGHGGVGELDADAGLQVSIEVKSDEVDEQIAMGNSADRLRRGWCPGSTARCSVWRETHRVRRAGAHNARMLRACVIVPATITANVAPVVGLRSAAADSTPGPWRR